VPSGDGEIVMADLVLQLLETAGNDRGAVERYVRGFTPMPDLAPLPV
jgi:hypothetical protein